MKKITSLLVLLSFFLFPVSNVYAAEIPGNVTEVLVPTQWANKSAKLYIPTSSCGGGNTCPFNIYVNDNLVSYYKVTPQTKVTNTDTNQYYEIPFDFSSARQKGAENKITVASGSTAVETVAYTPKETNLAGGCGTKSTLVTAQDVILTRRVGTNDVEKYYELINIINSPAGYDVVAGTGIEYPVSIYYTYQGTNQSGSSLFDYNEFITDVELSMYTQYLPDKVNLWYPTDNPSYVYKIPYFANPPKILENEVFLQTYDDGKYTTGYYTEEDAVKWGLIAAGYKKIESSKRTEYQWRRDNYTWEAITDNSITNKDTCAALNNDPNNRNASIDSSTTCRQLENGNPTYECTIGCGTSVSGTFYEAVGFPKLRIKSFTDKYTSSCDVDKSDCDSLLKSVQNQYPQFTCRVEKSIYKPGGEGAGDGSKAISCNKDGCKGRVIEEKTVTFCSYDKKNWFTEYYIGGGNWSRNPGDAVWTIERPENTYEGENITQIGSRETYRYYITPSGNFAYQTTQLIKYELPETYIEKGTSYIYNKEHIPSSNVIYGGRRLYTDLKASSGPLTLKIYGKNIGMNKYTYDTTCTYNLIANGLYDKNNFILYRPIDPKDPFPKYAPLANWVGKESLITKLGYGVYTKVPEYQIMLTPANTNQIRSYNDTHKYLDYNLNEKEESDFIHKSFSSLFKINKK